MEEITLDEIEQAFHQARIHMGLPADSGIDLDCPMFLEEFRKELANVEILHVLEDLQANNRVEITAAGRWSLFSPRGDMVKLMQKPKRWPQFPYLALAREDENGVLVGPKVDPIIYKHNGAESYASFGLIYDEGWRCS